MSLYSAFLIPLTLAAACLPAEAQRATTNYDEASVGGYTLPDPLVSANGKRVRNREDWNRQRRPEIVKLYETNVFGRSAPAKRLSSELLEMDAHALGGTAVRKQRRVYFSADKDGPKMDLLEYLPAGAGKPVPVFLGLNFTGNQTVDADPGIRLGEVWLRDATSKTKGDEKSRGSASSRWQVEKVLARGYGIATIYYGDIEPDFAGGIQYGIRPLFFKAGQTEPAPDEWGAIGAWAWGLSRALDVLEADKDVDAKRVVLVGHSRLGKTALWAGALDTRFAIAVSNCSGEGGAAISRRNFGETVSDLNTRFPHWYCGNFKKFSDHVDQLPLDSHMLIALMAPRPVYVASAAEDRWADPRGEFLGAMHAGPVYRLLGKQGLDTEEMPRIHEPIQHTVAYHIRAGKHDITEYDWEQYLNFADLHLKKAAETKARPVAHSPQ